MNNYPSYKGLRPLMEDIPEPVRSKLWNIYLENHERFTGTQGSSHNHQTWKGGYYDHVREVTNIAEVLYGTLSSLRKLPFKLTDALIVLFLHDIEKPWKEEYKLKKEERETFRRAIISTYEIPLTEEQSDALRYVEGENSDYSSEKRNMNELAAFCHMCDIASARIWHDRPRVSETWGWRIL